MSTEQLVGKKLVCITCDDGCDLDYIDYLSDALGDIPGFHTLLDRSSAWLPQYSDGPRAVSFVIASAADRAVIDRETGNGLDLWSDYWWEECAARGVLGIANHSWDHVHECLDKVRQRDNKKGSFLEIACFADAEAQIADAQRYIDLKTKGKAQPFFGYPFGHVPIYLRDEYFPAEGRRIGVQAAFGTGGATVNERSCIWDIPRFVCGFHWKTPEDFESMLDASAAGGR